MRFEKCISLSSIGIESERDYVGIIEAHATHPHK